jgi:hypothetical protein
LVSLNSTPIMFLHLRAVDVLHDRLTRLLGSAACCRSSAARA